jgi:hypothetical protein
VTDGLAVMTACFHEGGHAIAAVRLGLPLAQVVVRDNGCGTTRYTHWLGVNELPRWIVSAYAGGASEADRFPGPVVDGADRRAIEAALAATGVNWSAARLDELRAQAVQLVRAERRAIMKIANELLRLRSLSGEQVRRLVD